MHAMIAEEDGDLMLCREHGLAYQKDRNHVIEYGVDYFDKCMSYEGQEIANKLNAGRVALVNRYVGQNKVVDIGIGSGEFIKSRDNTHGLDVNPVAVAWLRSNGLWAGNFQAYSGYAMWDVIEHIPSPEVYLGGIQLHRYLFVSIPVFEDLDRIRESRHYRPGEHLQYFTRRGFIEWMGMHGFMLLEVSDHETKAGRDSILSFAFRRYRWPEGRSTP